MRMTSNLARLVLTMSVVLLTVRVAAGQPVTRPAAAADPRDAALDEQAAAIDQAKVAARAFAGGASRVEVIHNDNPVFSLHVPPGFYRQPDNDKFLLSLATSDPADGIPDVFVAVQRMRGTIGTEPAVLPAGVAPNLKVGTVRWSGFDLEAATRRVTTLGQTLDVCVVQVPIRGEAIQLMVAVPPAKTATLDALTAKFLAGLDGASSWTYLSPGDQSALRVGGAAALVADAAGIALLVFLLRRHRRRKAAVPTAATAPTEIAVRRGRNARDFGPLLKSAAVVLATYVMLASGWCLVIANGPPIVPNFDARAAAMGRGGMLMSIWVGAITFGVWTFLARRRAKTQARIAPVPPPWGAPPSGPSASPGSPPPPVPGYHALDHVVDD